MKTKEEINLRQLLPYLGFGELKKQKIMEEQLIQYIGDISKNDALVLKEMAEKHAEILEFGCGASTQVLIHYHPAHCIKTIDTSMEWMDKTYDNISLFTEEAVLGAAIYSDFFMHLKKEETWDFIFDDGVDHLRREFAIKIWPQLKVGGILAFHDTRRAPDFRNVLEVLAHFQDEIGKVEFNYKSSNITLVHKKTAEPWTNWQIDENKKPYELGYGPLPQEFIDSLKNRNNEKI